MLNLELTNEINTEEKVFVIVSNDNMNISKALEERLPDEYKYISSISELERKISTNEGLLVHTGTPGSKKTLLIKLIRNKSSKEKREAGAKIFKKLKQYEINKCFIYIDENIIEPQSIIEGLILSSYTYDKFKPNQTHYSITLYHNPLSIHETKKLLISSEAVNFTRYLSDTPPNEMTPQNFANEIHSKFKHTAIQVEIWDKERCEKERFSGITNVSKGSTNEPKFIVLKYNRSSLNDQPIFLIGKAITFDSGGICIKSAKNMADMKFDMCGGATIVGVLNAIEKMQLNVNIIGLIPTCENMTGASAYKPGDIIRARNGKTIEIINTDAEGRLILMDALCYASEQKPKLIIDIATLTGAISVSLGNYHTGLFSNDPNLTKQLLQSSKKVDEPLWQLPLCQEQRDDMKSNIADLVNHSEISGASSSKAAAFLSEFISPHIPWAHLDIAGTANAMSDRSAIYPEKMASGIMVRTLIEFIKDCSLTE